MGFITKTKDAIKLLYFDENDLDDLLENGKCSEIYQLILDICENREILKDLRDSLERHDNDKTVNFGVEAGDSSSSFGYIRISPVYAACVIQDIELLDLLLEQPDIELNEDK